MVVFVVEVIAISARCSAAACFRKKKLVNKKSHLVLVLLLYPSLLFLRIQTPESKKEEFRKYLEKSGVIDALTKVLVGLYEEPERPPNAVDYIKR